MISVTLPPNRMAETLASSPAFEDLPKGQRQKAAKLLLKLISEARGEIVGEADDLDTAFAWGEIQARSIIERLAGNDDELDLVARLRTELSSRRRKMGGRRERYLETDDCRALVQEVRRSAQLQTVAVSDEQIRLVAGSEYRAAVLKLVRDAGQRLWLSSFYFRHGPSGSRFMRDLLSAIGTLPPKVDIRILLEGRETRKAPAETVNMPAIDLLKATPAKVRLHNQEGERMHAKIVISDDRHGLLGSHNLTAGSAYRYDDLSVMVEAPEIVAGLAEHFVKLWQSAGKD